VRDALARTGVLFTQHEDDLGHIPDFWRAAILGLCDALDAAPVDVAEQLRAERGAHDVTISRLSEAHAAHAEALAEVEAEERRRAAAEADGRVAVQLVAEAVPRMRTLNNAMSPGWLARASSLLGE